MQVNPATVRSAGNKSSMLNPCTWTDLKTSPHLLMAQLISFYTSHAGCLSLLQHWSSFPCYVWLNQHHICFHCEVPEHYFREICHNFMRSGLCVAACLWGDSGIVVKTLNEIGKHKEYRGSQTWVERAIQTENQLSSIEAIYTTQLLNV